MRLLLVEDDVMLGKGLKKGLEYEHYSVEWVGSVADAEVALHTGGFDLAVVDINLPDGSGLALLNCFRATKARAAIPVLLLTAVDNPATKIQGLDGGADDYLTKPFDLGELLARLRAIIRRKSGLLDNILRSKHMELNLVTKRLTHHGNTYSPSAQEFKILSLLMQRPGIMISKNKIEEELYGWDGDVDSNTVEVIIYNLRKKLGKEVIISMRGVGYMVAA